MLDAGVHRVVDAIIRMADITARWPVASDDQWARLPLVWAPGALPGGS